MQFSAKNQKGLAIDDELSCIAALFKMGEHCTRVARLGRSQSGSQRGQYCRDEKGS